MASMHSFEAAQPSANLHKPQRCSIRAITSAAPALDSGSLRLPHLGDCTHDGQPDSHGHSPISRCASPTSASNVAEALRVMPDAARVAVVDEDRRAAGLRVEVGRQAADVPAVAHRQQRQHGDLRVLGGVQRAEQQLAAGSRREQVVAAARTRAPAS